jgi:ERCC4-type nuclease
MIDRREPDWVHALRFGGVPTISTTLEYGDVLGATSDGALIAIERKTPMDLLGSIKDNRLFNQAAGMRQQTPWAYLVVTGILGHTPDGRVAVNGQLTAWNWDSVQGALLSVQEMGVGIIAALAPTDFEETVLRLARRKRSPDKVLEPVCQPRFMSPAEQLLTALPGIGWERAQVLLKEFGGRAGMALAWLTWKGTVYQVDGIGEMTKQSVRNALGLDADEELCVMDEDKYLTDSLNRAANKLRELEQQEQELQEQALLEKVTQ